VDQTRLAIARQENVTLLITDVNMPGMDGLDLARRVTEECRDVRVLVISGRVADAGSVAFLPKPFSRPELLRRVAELLNERSL
jgi:DNA-binding response OmpR family regulator